MIQVSSFQSISKIYKTLIISLPAPATLCGVGTTCFFLRHSPVNRHIRTNTFLAHGKPYTIHPSFLWPSSASITIHTHIDK